MASPDSDKRLPGQITELRDLVVAYAKQETVDPLRSLGRFVGWGLAGSALLAIGIVLLSLAGLRVLQQETAPHWTRNLTWIPYTLAFAWTGLVAWVLARRITAERRRARKQRGR